MLTQASTGIRALGPLRLGADTLGGARKDVVSAVYNNTALRVAFANTHLLYCAVRDQRFAELMRSFYIINDGVGVNLLARLSNGRGFAENLNGTDFTPHILRALPWGTRIMMVGSRPSVVRDAGARVQRSWPQLEVCACHDGFEGKARALEELNELSPQVVLVGMGNPIQEQWIDAAAQKLPDAVFIGVGALFDFIAGAVPRAPEGVRKWRLEWAFRLTREPARLWRRYTVEVLVVFVAVLLSTHTKRPH